MKHYWRLCGSFYMFANLIISFASSALFLVRSISIEFIGFFDEHFKDRNAVMTVRWSVLIICIVCSAIDFLSGGSGPHFTRLIFSEDFESRSK